jgi:hypothetical protein
LRKDERKKELERRMIHVVLYGDKLIEGSEELAKSGVSILIDG